MYLYLGALAAIQSMSSKTEINGKPFSVRWLSSPHEQKNFETNEQANNHEINQRNVQKEFAPRYFFFQFTFHSFILEIDSFLIVALSG